MEVFTQGCNQPDVTDLDQNVFGLEVGVNDATFPV